MLRLRVEREMDAERIVIELRGRRVRVEGVSPEPLLDIPLDDGLLLLLKKWLEKQAGVKEVQDGKAQRV